jgi:hypothetical protein
MKPSTEIFSNCAETKTLEDYQSTSRGLDPGVKMLNTLPNGMHQMHISNTQVSSVMLRSKKLEIQEKRDN